MKADHDVPLTCVALMVVFANPNALMHETMPALDPSLPVSSVLAILIQLLGTDRGGNLEAKCSGVMYVASNACHTREKQRGLGASS